MNDTAGRPPGRVPRLLVVAMSDSVHVANWLNMIAGGGWQVFLLPVYQAPLSSRLADPRPIAVGDPLPREPGGVHVLSLAGQVARLDRWRARRPWRPAWLEQATLAGAPLIARAVRWLQPDLVHSMEVQLAGYMCADAKRLVGRSFPPWLLSNWGSDLYLYRKLPEHRGRLRAVLGAVDYYLSECQRDLAIARDLGFAGTSFPPVPAAGGIDLGRYADILAAAPPPSRRDVIQVKAYHGWSGRGLTVMAALRLAAPALAGFKVRVLLAGELVQAAARDLAAETGLDITCLPYMVDHDDVLRHVAGARVAVGIGISDGISTSLLEAMTFGAFPVQSDTACADEWVEDGRSGFVVSPHDTRQIADRLARAACEDRLVDEAARLNHETIRRRWHVDVVRTKVLDYYDRILSASRRMPA